MKDSLEDQIRKLIAFKKTEPTALYESDTVKDGPSVLDQLPSEKVPKGGGIEGERGCSYSRIGMGDPSYLWGGSQPGSYNSTVNHTIEYGDCPLCRESAPPAFCTCIAAYSNPCYNWHWSNGAGGLGNPTWDPPAYSSYPPGCPSREELQGPGYTEEEWIGDPETLTGQRYRWFAWDYLTRIRRPDGTWSPGQLSPWGDSLPNYGEGNPFDPDALASTMPRITMRQLWEFYLSETGYGAFRPTLMQRKRLESGCNGNPDEQMSACCTTSEFGGFSCDLTTSADCAGTFYSGKTCADINNDNCGLAPNPIQQNDQTKKQKQAIDMLMSCLKRS